MDAYKEHDEAGQETGQEAGHGDYIVEFSSQYLS